MEASHKRSSMSDRDLMQQALDAMMTIRPYEVVDYDQLEASITALRERLAQPEQTVSMTEYKRLQDLVTSQGIRLMEYESAQPEMEPCAGRNCGSTNPNLHSAECFEDYEKSTGMNQWQGLTDKEINSICYKRDWTAPWTDTTFARAIEAKLREKNT